MKRQTLILLAITVMFALTLLGTGCTSLSPGGPDVPPVTTVTVTEQSTCGLTTCHGLDLACGKNAPQVCTMEYRLGDKCRQYAQCTSGSDGSCTLVTNPQFVSCTSCIEKCVNASVNNPQQAFACEAKC